MVGESCGWAKKVSFVSLMAILVLALSSPVTAGMRFRLGISYIEGFDEVVDQYEDNLEFEVGPMEDTDMWPVGLTLFPYYQWDSGLTLGAGIGPFMLIYGDADHFQLPLSVSIGYVVGPDEPVSFYVRGGPSYHVADGDYVDGSNLGVVGAIGLEFLKSSHFLMGVEAAFDTAEVDIENSRTRGTEGIKAAEFTVSLFFVFK